MKQSSLSSVTPDVRKDYLKRVLFDTVDLPPGGHMLQEVTIPPHTKQRAHYHNIQTEVFYILSGECHIFINEAQYLTKPGDAFVCSPREVHSLWNRSDLPFRLLVFKINRPEDNEDSVWSE